MDKLIFAFLTLCLTSCAQVSADKKPDNNQVAWDFDHQVQFQQKRLDDGRYYLNVRANSKTHFTKLASFLLRKSYQLCGNYGFNIEVLQGVEGYYDRVSFPNLIMDSLAANISCANSEHQ